MIRDIFNDSAYTFLDSKDSSVLRVMSLEPEKIEANYYFNNNQICNRIVVNYYCSRCVPGYLYTLTSGLNNEWVKMGDNEYISTIRTSLIIGISKSRKSTCKVMRVVQTPNEAVCMSVTFTLEDFQTRVWKEIITTETSRADSLKPQKNGCKKLFSGTWIYSDSTEINTYIERTTKQQIEYVENGKYFIKYKIKWIDNCAYEMIFEYSDYPEFSEYEYGESITVHILDMNDKKMKYIAYDCTSEYTGILIRIE